jgi:hypothetical protein
VGGPALDLTMRLQSLFAVPQNSADGLVGLAVPTLGFAFQVDETTYQLIFRPSLNRSDANRSGVAFAHQHSVFPAFPG